MMNCGWSTTAVFGMLFVSSCFANESSFTLPVTPTEAGRFDPEASESCPDLTGSYVLLGKLISRRVSSPMDLNLESVLGAPYLQAAYDPAYKLYANILFSREAHQLVAEIFVAPRSAKWSTQLYTCDQGWLKLSRNSGGASEGNNTKVAISSYLRKNAEGDLVVYQHVKGRTSNMFGLVWSNIDDEDWLLFKKYIKQ